MCPNKLLEGQRTTAQGPEPCDKIQTFKKYLISNQRMASITSPEAARFGRRVGQWAPHLQGDPILHQQANLDVHEIEVLLQLLIGPDLPDHLFLELQQLCLSQEVLVALIQEVGESAYHAERGMGHVDWQEGQRRQD